MTITRPLFCKICGAALPAQVMRCPGCGNAVPVSPSHSAAPSPGLSASASDATQQPGPGFLLAGRYMLLEKIGEGGFGVVYKARDRRRPAPGPAGAESAGASTTAADAEAPMSMSHQKLINC